MAEGGRESESSSDSEDEDSLSLDSSLGLLFGFLGGLDLLSSSSLLLSPRLTPGDVLSSLRNNSEKRYDLRIVVVGHLAAGKTVLIDRILGKPVDITTRNSTNGIVVIRRGGIQVDDGKWLHKWKPSDIDVISKRIKDAIAKGPVSREMELTISSIKAFKKDLIKVVKTPREKRIICQLLFFDFAGQSVFNSCHQMFMSHRAFYLLVIDISRALDSEVEDDDVFCVGANRRMTVEELTKFLLSSIHMYRGQEPHEFPKVLLVGTHKDKEDEVIAKQKIEKLKESFRGTPLQQHVVGDVIVDNSIPNDPGLEDLKSKIFQAAKGESFWGEEIPNKWMPLEMRITEKRDEGARILTLRDIKKFSKESYAPLDSTEEIREFLMFHNNAGNMMYYGGLDDDDIVVLDPQWLIDALKQIITHEQFYIIVEGFADVWKEFTQSAKLHKKLIEAVWSKHDDKSFIEHKDKAIEILEMTGIISCPKVYDVNGTTIEQDFFFVPSMLRPSQEGVSYVDGLLQLCPGRSSTLCFVFKDNFMPPAIFPRIQAACNREYRIKESKGMRLFFYKLAVFKLNKSYDLLLEHVEHAIRITVLNEDEDHISSNVCLSILSFLEESLTDVTKLYCNSGREVDLPFEKAVQCKEAEGKLDALHSWNDLSGKKKILCLDHAKEKGHRLETSTIMTFWNIVEETEMPRIHKGKKQNIKKHHSEKLGCIELGRLSRALTLDSLRTLASQQLELPQIEQMEHENTGCLVDFKFALLFTMAKKNKDGVSVKSLHQDFMDCNVNISTDVLNEALQDKDSAVCFEGIPDSFLEKTLSDQSLDQICQGTGKEYKQLAIELGVQPSIIDRIVLENKKIFDRTRAILKENPKFTHNDIGQAIVQVGVDSNLIRNCFMLSK